MTVPVTLSNQIPQSYFSELSPLPDEDTTGGMIGLPLRRIDLLNLLASRFPDAGILRVNDEPGIGEVIIVVRSSLGADAEVQLREFIDSFQLPLTLTIEVAASSETATHPDIDDPMFVWAANLRSGAPTYVKQDEIFWFDNIANIYCNRFPIQCFPGMQDVSGRCYFDLSLGENHINLRQALLMYDEIWCSVPLTEKQDNFLAVQGLTKLCRSTRTGECRAFEDTYHAARGAFGYPLLGRGVRTQPSVCVWPPHDRILTRCGCGSHG